ncbi:MAG: TetR/AcrR family transcriptional regulator [Oligosphaeraceae bacterium]
MDAVLKQIAARRHRRPYGGNARKAREILLSAGLKIFAEKGYERARIREICEVSRKNLASVNYYFRDKAGYYQEVREYARKLRLEEIETLLASENKDPWDALSRHIGALVGYSYDEDMFYAAWMYLREFLEDSEEDDDPRAQEYRIKYEAKIRDLLIKILGDKASEQNIALLHYTYASLSLFLLLEAPHFGSDHENPLQVKPWHTPDQLRDHVMGIVRYTVEHMEPTGEAVAPFPPSED